MSGPANPARLAIGALLLAVAVAAVSVLLAIRPPALTPAAVGPATLALFVVTGLAVAAAGCVAIVAYPRERFGRLTVLVALAWFAQTWASPRAGSPFVFTAGLLLVAAVPALVADATLGFRGLAGRAGRPVVAAGYAICIGLLGIGGALTGGATIGCETCSADPLAVDALATLGDPLAAVGLLAAAVWAVAAVGAGTWGLLRSSGPARRTAGPVVVPALGLLAAFAFEAARSVPQGWIGVDDMDQAAWIVEAAALIAIAGGVGLRVARDRRTRAALAAIVIELARGDAGGLQGRLRSLLVDPTLVLAYPVGAGLVDVGGVAVSLRGGDGRVLTPILRGREPVAWMEHRAGLEQDPDRLGQIASAAGLALEHERLVAESRYRLEEVRTSRTRVIDAMDRERMRLERDLHDGAQQRLAGLALAIRLARGSVAEDGVLADAEAEVRATIADVRDVAHGIHPAVLADLGLAPAIRAIAEDAPIPVRVDALPGAALPSAVASTALLAVAALVRGAGATRADVGARVDDGALRLRVILDGAGPTAVAPLRELEDRVDALDGSLVVGRAGDRTTVELVLPCAS